MTRSKHLSVPTGDMDAFWMQTVSPQETSKLTQTETGEIDLG